MMSRRPKAAHRPDEKPIVGRSAHDTIRSTGKWSGPTYYGRSQLKPAPFNNWVVGGYIALAGLSGAASIIGAIAERADPGAGAQVARRSRYFGMLAPTLGSLLLIYDLHTPQRFYNMLRIAKRTSPMSIGTWILMAFTGPALLAGAAQGVADLRPSWRWPWALARAAQLPAAIAGAGLSTYTASLLAATSTPLWAAAPQSMAVRFGASSLASGAAAIALGRVSRRSRRALDALAVAALATELAATLRSHERYYEAGVEEALHGPWGAAEQLGATGLGIVLPLGLKLLGALIGDRSRLADQAILAGSLLLRVSIMGAGDVSAERPDISFRFSQPANLQHPRLARTGTRRHSARHDARPKFNNTQETAQ